MIISLANQKGGVGKSTLATNLAFGFSKMGKALLIDSDPQGSSLDWMNARESETEIHVIGFPRPNLHKEIKKIGEGYDTIIIDTPPHSSDMVRSAISASDLALIPVQPSPYDVWSVSETVKLIQEISTYKESLKAAFIINRKIVNTSIGNAVVEALDEYELPVLKSHICQRIVFPETASFGKSVFEKSGEARMEFQNLLNDIMELAHD